MGSIRNKHREGKKARESARVVIPGKTEITRVVERATGGDFEAFGKLYSIYMDRIYRYVFYQVRDKMAAEDATEEVFLKAWKAIDSCKGKEQTFLSWLYKIARNHIIDYLRSRQRYAAKTIDSISEVSNPESEAEQELEWQDLLEEISYLPDNQKQVIILKFTEGLDNSEIGRIMGKSQGAIRVLQMRALTTLRRRLRGK